MKIAVLEGYNCSLTATCISCGAALRIDVGILLLKWIIIHTLFFSNTLLQFNIMTDYSHSTLQPRLGGQINETESV